MADDFRAPIQPIRSTWNAAHLLRRGPLTDRKIEQYRKDGWYSAELRAARKELQAKRKAKSQMRREGSFLVDGGRMIYSPNV